jgi:glycosyltransferase involved in cell wall biosynthesis
VSNFSFTDEERCIVKILYHHRTRAEDAQGIHIGEMVKAFRDLGHEVEVVALVTKDEGKGKPAQGDILGGLTRWVPAWLYELMSLLYNLYGYRRLCQMIRSTTPDLIYERYALNTFCGVWASRRFGIPMVLEVNAPLYHEQMTLGRLAFPWLARFSERWICSHSTRTVVVSQVMKDILAQEGVPDEHMVVMPNGIDPQRFHPQISGEAVRQKYGLDGSIVVGFVGWFRPWHGLEMLLDVMREPLHDTGQVRLLLIGDGPAYADLLHYVNVHRMQASVVFTGPISRSDIAAHIAAMDIAVQPAAPPYACPMKILEYMSMGRCVVAPDQPNIREILTDRVNGMLFRPDDRAHLQQVLADAIRYGAVREAMGRQAYLTVQEQGYVWSANAEKTLALVRRQAGLPPSCVIDQVAGHLHE